MLAAAPAEILKKPADPAAEKVKKPSAPDGKLNKLAAPVDELKNPAAVENRTNAPL